MAITIELPAPLEEQVNREAMLAGRSPAEHATLLVRLATALAGGNPDAPFQEAGRSSLWNLAIDPILVASACDVLIKLGRRDGPDRSESEQSKTDPVAGLDPNEPYPRVPHSERISILGKYAHLGLSSEDYAREKRAEIEREDRH